MYLALLVARQHEIVLEGVELEARAAPGVQLEHSCVNVPPQLVVRVLLGPASMISVFIVKAQRISGKRSLCMAVCTLSAPALSSLQTACCVLQMLSCFWCCVQNVYALSKQRVSAACVCLLRCQCSRLAAGCVGFLAGSSWSSTYLPPVSRLRMPASSPAAALVLASSPV